MTDVVYTTESCISCHRCVRVCPSRGANIASMQSLRPRINVDSTRCVGCGACLEACDHGARAYLDDTEAFFDDLERGERISLLVAPSFLASYPNEYRSVLGGLKALGVNHIYSVSFGADICTWAYLNYIKTYDFFGGISSTCPAVVSYVEHCLPELIPFLMPVQSPLECLARYCRDVLGITDKLAFVSPCIEKKREMEHAGNTVSYNVTFRRLMAKVRAQHISGPLADDEICYGLGAVYPVPGGLKENIQWFLGSDRPVRQIEGRSFFSWLNNNAALIEKRFTPYILIDALNCDEGCLCGPAVEERRMHTDEARWELLAMRQRATEPRGEGAWIRNIRPKERLKALNEQFSHLRLEDYLRTFVDRSDASITIEPSSEELDEIFCQMHKLTKESRVINCSFCGYDSCHEMAVSIYNGFNEVGNCTYYQKEEAIRLERMSYRDSLTGALNRNAYEKLVSRPPSAERGLCVVLGDVNGLKKANDRWGHAAGDALIKGCASCLMEIFGNDNVYRYGGDEFLAVCSNHLPEEVVGMMEQARILLLKNDLSMSLGFAYTKTEHAIFARLTKEADKLMYAEKRSYHAIHGDR